LMAGEPILELDVSESALALEKARQSLALKENQQAKARLDLQATLVSLASQVEIKKLQLETFEASAARNAKLFAEGLVAEEVFRQSKLDAARTKLELAQLGDSRAVAERSAKVQEDALALEMDTLRKELKQADRQVTLATARSEAAGVLTFALTEAGASVR